jgi:hypothetical protein
MQEVLAVDHREHSTMHNMFGTATCSIDKTGPSAPMQCTVCAHLSAVTGKEKHMPSSDCFDESIYGSVAGANE